MFSIKAARKEATDREKAKFKSVWIGKLVQKETLEEVQRLKNDLIDLDLILSTNLTLADEDTVLIDQIRSDAKDLISSATPVPFHSHRTALSAMETLPSSPIRPLPSRPAQRPPLPSPATPPHSPISPYPSCSWIRRVDFASPSDLDSILTFCHHLDNPQQSFSTQGTEPKEEDEGRGESRGRRRQTRRRTHRHPLTCAVM